MKIIRYSHHGFKPQFQSHYQKQIDYILTDYKSATNQKELNKMASFAREITIKSIEQNRQQINPKFNLFGIHVFFETASNKDI